MNLFGGDAVRHTYFRNVPTMRIEIRRWMTDTVCKQQQSRSDSTDDKIKNRTKFSEGINDDLMSQINFFGPPILSCNRPEGILSPNIIFSHHR